MNLCGYTKGGETARTGSVLFDASTGFKFPTLSSDASHDRRVGGALGDRALPVPCAGNLFCPVKADFRPPLRNANMIPYSLAERKWANLEILECGLKR